MTGYEEGYEEGGCGYDNRRKQSQDIRHGGDVDKTNDDHRLCYPLCSTTIIQWPIYTYIGNEG